MKKQNIIKAFSLVELSIVILVIGILVIGITKGSRIVKEARLKSARSLTAGSPVNSIENLAFWLDVTDNQTISSSATCVTSTNNYGNISNGYFVNKWDDKNSQSTNKITVEVANTAHCPTYVEDGIGGLPTLNFDGTNDALQSTIAAISKGNKNVTVFAVVKKSTSGSLTAYFSQFASTVGGTSANDYLILYAHSTTNMYPTTACGGTSCFTEKSGGVNGVATNSYVMGTVYNSNVLYGIHYVNGTGYQGNAGMASNWSIGNGLLLIGSGRSSSANNQFFPGYISEIIVFNRTLKLFEINSVNDYLMKKYSIR